MVYPIRGFRYNTKFPALGMANATDITDANYDGQLVFCFDLGLF